ILGDRLKAYRPKRKHWWHASLRPALNGLTSGVVHAEVDFELTIDLQGSAMSGHTSEGAHLYEGLDGRSMAEIAAAIDSFLADSGVDTDRLATSNTYNAEKFAGYSAGHAGTLGQVLAAVNAAMTRFRAGIREETSPIQLWPHHFDLSMLWLPGEKIEGQDPDNEEYSDKQMNFGFTFGDEGIPEPYFYVTAYPLPDGFPSLDLPAGTEWRSDGFSGAVLLYKTLLASGDPHGYLQDLWTGLLTAGRDQLRSAHTSS
ncbi:MAG: DUF5996 family protein, partial [Woeseiaceae bacterium]